MDFRPAASFRTVLHYTEKLRVIRRSAERAGRDPLAIVPAFVQACLIGDDAELAKILDAPLVKAVVFQLPADLLRTYGFDHPLGQNWRGIQDINPSLLTRERIVAMLEVVDPDSILAVLPHGTPKKIAGILRSYVEAGVRVARLLDYGGMAGLDFAARSAEKEREVEDELTKLVAAA
jgi:phthiodiolone/phenolphthiodiolone dimycocerosates ketoreductase